MSTVGWMTTGEHSLRYYLPMNCGVVVSCTTPGGQTHNNIHAIQYEIKALILGRISATNK